MIAPLPAFLSLPATQRWAARIFCVYALAIFVLTHWPNLSVPIPVQRPDILVHMAVFGLWTLLAAACGWFGFPLARRNIWPTSLIALAAAAFDEGTQAIPIVRRHAGWDDFGANVLGIAAATAALLALGRATKPRIA